MSALYSGDSRHRESPGRPSKVTGESIDVRQRDLAWLSGQAWKALGEANDPPQLFRYGGLQVRIEHDDENCYTAQP